MDQDTSGMREGTDLPGDLPNDIDEPGSAELAADLLREQATGPVPLGPAAPSQGEDVVLLVETVSFPDQDEVLSSEGLFIGELDPGDDSPWYRSRWLYIGAGLASGAVLAAGAVLLLRNRNTSRQGSAQRLIGQWSDQLSNQTNKLIKQARKPARRQTALLAGALSSLTHQASDLTDQAQKQFNRLAKGSQTSGMRLSRQTRANANKWLKQTQQQLADLSHQAGDQLGFLGEAIGSSTSQAIDRTQGGLEQIRQGVVTGAAKTGEGIETGWKLSRNFTLGMAAGALWAALFTPQSGETTRERLNTIFQSRGPKTP
jgi:hypothetical protein